MSTDQYYTNKESAPKASNSTHAGKGPQDWYRDSKRSVGGADGGPELFYDDDLPF